MVLELHCFSFSILLIGAVVFTALWTVKYVANLYSHVKQKEGTYIVTDSPVLREIKPTYFPMTWERLLLTTAKENSVEYVE